MSAGSIAHPGSFQDTASGTDEPGGRKVNDTALPLATASCISKRAVWLAQFWRYTLCLGVVISAFGYILSGSWLLVMVMDFALLSVGVVGSLYAFFLTRHENKPYQSSDSIFRSP